MKVYVLHQGIEYEEYPFAVFTTLEDAKEYADNDTNEELRWKEKHDGNDNDAWVAETYHPERDKNSPDFKYAWGSPWTQKYLIIELPLDPE